MTGATDGHLGLTAGKAEIVDRARVEVAAIADPGQVKLETASVGKVRNDCRGSLYWASL